MNRIVPFEELPERLDVLRAVEIGYDEPLQQAEDALRSGLSLLLECDKSVVSYAYRILRSRLSEDRREGKLRCVYVDGRGGESTGGAVIRILRQLEGELAQDPLGRVVVIPHLDAIATTTQAGLTGDAREALAMLSENPEAVVLGFCDPTLSLPEAIENLFPRRIRMVGVPREALPRLVCPAEARKLSADGLDTYRLYKYVSGLNPVRLRKVLSGLSTRSDLDPANPQAATVAFSYLRETTKMQGMELPNVNLEKDIGGYGSIKKRLREDIIELLVRRDAADRDTSRFIENLIPRGIIFWGPPGTGKTYFAKAIASAIDAVVSVVSGPEVKSKWVGESEANIRRVFAEARRAAPAIIIFDELDSFATRRGTYLGSGAEHSMVNQLLTEMDGFRKEELVLVVGTTNFLDSLDPALLRPGRFELTFHVPPPEAGDRREILQIYRDRFQLDMDDRAMEYAVRRTSGAPADRSGSHYTGDHLYALCRALKREELRRGKLQVAQGDIDRILRREEPARLLAEEERIVAVHECGHALVSLRLERSREIETVTLTPDEPEALGTVVHQARERRYVTTERDLRDEICILLAGRQAERLVFQELSCGAWGDLQAALSIARVMVEEFGMGPDGRAATVLPRQDRQQAGEEARRQIDQAVSAIVEGEEERARSILSRGKSTLNRIAEELLKRRELPGDRVKELMNEVEGEDLHIAGE